ncbi:glycosyltransferase [Oryzomicrobium sp.]|uniref:glycosyltransferase n=1 Tax=Oryzomicrobium sp. TaxID=1911578 RepID=UPI002FE2E9A9
MDQASPYQNWIKTHTFQQTDGVDFENRMQEWGTQPHFHIAVVLDMEPAAALGNSLQSLASQYYPHLRVTVSAPLPSPANLPPDRVQWIESTSPWLDANNALQASAPGSWVGLLRAGDTLALHALLVTAEYLHTHPAVDAVYTDEDIKDATGYRHTPKFKPDFDLEWLRSSGYVGGVLLVKSDVWKSAGGWLHFSDHQDEFDLALRLAEQLPPTSFGHVADVLYHRSADHPTLAAGYAEHNAQLIHLQQHLARCNPEAVVTPGPIVGTSRVIYPLQTLPRVSILIPATDELGHLQRCLETLFEQTDYPDFELLIVDNTALAPATRTFLHALEQLDDTRIHIIRDAPPAPRAALFNLAAEASTGALLLLLNQEIAALHSDWLSEMVALTQQPEVGAVGARLLRPDGTLQHAGYVLGLNATVASPLAGQPAEHTDPLLRTQVLHQVSAASSDALLIHRDLYLALGGMDAQQFPMDFHDVDLCLKVRAKGRRILWTPFATLLYAGPCNAQAPAAPTLYNRWMPHLTRDPAYNSNLSLQDAELDPEPEAALSWNPTPWHPHPRLLVHPVDQTGSGQYRILGPVRALHDANLLRGHASQRFFSPVEIAKADMASIVVQIPTSARHLKALEIYRQHSEALCIAEADDLITEIPRASPLYHVIGKEAQDYFRRSLRIADRLVVTTEPLAAAYADLCQEVRVAKNYLPGHLWNHLTPNRKRTGKPRVGWAGSSSHRGDLALLDEIVKTLAKEVDWVFFGACPQNMLPYVKETIAGVSFDQYPGMLANMGLDLAVAPLENNAFNECKSSLKLLEYGILGYPIVCSSSGAYRGDFPVKRVSNTAKAWIAAIRERIHDLDATRKEGETLQAHIRQHWMLEDHLDEWLAAWTR